MSPQDERLLLNHEKTPGFLAPGEGNGNPLQYSCLGNPMDRQIWQPSPWGCKKVGHDLATKQQQ